MCEASALVRVERPVHPVSQPSAKHSNLLVIPFLKKMLHVKPFDIIKNIEEFINCDRSYAKCPIYKGENSELRGKAK